MTTIAEQAAAPTDANAMAQELIAAYGLLDAQAFVLIECPADAFWSDVAALLRLETQSDETPEEEGTRLYDEALTRNTPAAWAAFEAAREAYGI